MPAFNNDAVARIRKVVKTVEGQPRDLTGGTQNGQHIEPSFWAQLTGVVGTDLAYDWIRATPDGHGGFVRDTRARGANAYEVNGRTGIKPYTVVRLFLMGRGADGEPAYSFVAPPQETRPRLPIHDHRDNAHGGFAFCVMAPGTSLPAQAWGI